jgi:LysR family transcriptional regulator, glycine cleavage system transcriptional activator
MRYPLPSLIALHTFEAAARLGSFTAAAEELHLATSTVSHRVRELESSLGFALFERLPRSLRLTDHGKAYIPVVTAVFDELTMATSGLFGSPGAGKVTVRTPISYGVHFLGPRLERFTGDHDIRVWIVSEIWGDEGSDIDVDLEVVFADERRSLGDAEALATEEAVLVSSPMAITRSGRRGAGADGLIPVQVLGFEDLWHRLDRRDDILPPTADVTVDSWSAAIELVATSHRHGALVPRLLATGQVRAGRLVHVEGPSISMRQTYRLVRPKHPNPPTPETSLFADWLRSEHEQAAGAASG